MSALSGAAPADRARNPDRGRAGLRSEPIVALLRGLLVAASQGYPQGLALDVRRGPAWFRAMDRNGDGDTSRREFTGPADVFDKWDTDKDGLLSAEKAPESELVLRACLAGATGPPSHSRNSRKTSRDTRNSLCFPAIHVSPCKAAEMCQNA